MFEKKIVDARLTYVNRGIGFTGKPFISLFFKVAGRTRPVLIEAVGDYSCYRVEDWLVRHPVKCRLERVGKGRYASFHRVED